VVPVVSLSDSVIEATVESSVNVICSVNVLVVCMSAEVAPESPAFTDACSGIELELELDEEIDDTAGFATKLCTDIAVDCGTCDATAVAITVSAVVTKDFAVDVVVEFQFILLISRPCAITSPSIALSGLAVR